jgi:hypothetical protein
LHKDDLLELVENDAVASVQINPEGGFIVQVNQTSADLVKCKRKALLIINLSIGDALVAYVTNVIELIRCSNFFCDLFENSSTTRNILLKNKLNSLYLEEDPSQ